MLTETQQNQLRRLHNYRTAYEVVAENRDTGERLLVQYTERHSTRGLWDALRTRVEDVVRVCGATTATKMPSGKLALDGTPWVACFSGRTHREAIISGELPWIKEVRS